MNSFFRSVDMALPRRLVRAALVASVSSALALAGCGVRGNLDAGPEAKATGETVSPAAADAGGNSVVKPKPHKEFILDGLLR